MQALPLCPLEVEATVIELRSPYPYAGGKSRVADVIWRGLGADVNNYVEPFLGSGAVLLGRPGGAGKIETVNDIHGAIVNFWRAVVAAPDEVARFCDWPPSELDMHARHVWLVERLETMADRLRDDPLYFDAEVAGWWVWGAALWIGTGWCGGVRHGNPRPNLNSGQGIHAVGKRAFPHARVHLSSDNGIHRRQLPKISVSDGASGIGGVHSASLPSIGNDRGINGLDAPPAKEWFRALQARLRNVRIVCGDWKRVLGPSVLGKGKNVGGRKPCGIVFDAPYKTTLRARRIYAADEPGVSEEVCEWAIEHGDDPDLRIALCGYDGEHEMPSNWTVYAWKGARGYASEENENRKKERIWFSPHCLPIEQQPSLFGAING